MKLSPENTPVIVSAVRTPIGKFGRTLKDFPAPKLGAIVVNEALKRAPGLKATEIDEVIMGNVIAAGLGQNPARQASIFAGLPASVCATTENKVCGSGLKAIMFASQSIRAGDAELPHRRRDGKHEPVSLHSEKPSLGPEIWRFKNAGRHAA